MAPGTNLVFSPKLRILLFHTPHETLHAEAILKRHRRRFKVIPRPRKVQDDCGLAVVIWRVEAPEIEPLFPVEGVYIKAAFRIEEDGAWIREDYPPAPISYDTPASESPSPAASSWD